MRHAHRILGVFQALIRLDRLQIQALSARNPVNTARFYCMGPVPYWPAPTPLRYGSSRILYGYGRKVDGRTHILYY